MKIKLVLLILSFFILFNLLSCSTIDDKESYKNKLNDLVRSNDELKEKVSDLNHQINELNQKFEQLNKNLFLDKANKIVTTIKNRDMITLSSYVDSEKGLAFTVNHIGYDDAIFFPEDLENALSDTTIYTWITPCEKSITMDLNFEDFFNYFIYDEDCLNAEKITVSDDDSTIGSRLTSVTVKDKFPNSKVVEYTYEPEETPGFGWKRLGFVFQQKNSSWFLVGIIHAIHCLG